MQKVRYELEVGGAKGYLAPLSFPVAEAGLGYIYAPVPKYLTAGAIVINSLWVKGSPTLQENGSNYDEACLQAYSCLSGIDYEYKDGVIEIPHFKKEKDKDGKKIPYVFKCKVKEKINREILEECLSLIMPNVGNPSPLTAGKKLLLSNWIEGDEEIKTNDELLIPACLACYYLVNLKGSKLKKV